MIFMRVSMILYLTMTMLSGYIQDSAGVVMRDSVRLGTDLYYPQTSTPPWPSVLQRTPYSRYWDTGTISYITDYLGYVFIVQNLRGTGDSEGEPMFFLTDGWGPLQDGYDCIEWISQQSWSNGRTGMFGGSAHGITQYLAAGARPAHLTCCVPMVASPSMYHYTAFNGGEFRKALTETWLNSMGTPWLIDSICNHPDYDTMWSYVDLTARWDSASCPIFHITGWYDIFLDGQLDAFPQLQARFHNQRLFIGPWGHSSWGSQYQGDLVYPANANMNQTEFYLMMFDWYNYWLKDSTPALEPQVLFYLMGDCETQDTTNWNRWVQADTWPLPAVLYKNLYLHSGNLCDTFPPNQAGVHDTFAYDPQDPCPTYGGREYIGLSTGYGPINQNPIEGRPDVLVYTTPVLTAPVAVIGKLQAVLYAASNRFDTDWTVRITDVYPDGQSYLVTDNIMMARHRHGLDIQDSLVPGQPDTFSIDLWSTAQVFNAGHRIRVIVSSSNYPRFEKNPNTGAPFRRDDPNTLTARQTVYCSSDLPSRIRMPVYPLEYMVKESSSRLVIQPANAFFNVMPTLSRNPVMHLRLNQASEVIVKIYNPAGQCLETIRRTYGAGAHVFKLPPLACGIYFVKAAAGMDDYTTKIIIIK
ncbi:MAG TPA: CocE/NonD family hydrolase [bacterium]